MNKCKKGFLTAKRLVNVVAILLSFLIKLPVFAQSPASGTVTGKDGVPVAGVTIAVKNKKINAVSGTDGKFTIAANTGDVLIITSVGYDAYEVKIGNNKSIIASLTSKAETLDDVVVQVGDKLNRVFPGMLTSLADGFLVKDEFLQQCIEYNRSKGIKGEAFFYFEGLRRSPEFYRIIYPRLK